MKKTILFGLALLAATTLQAQEKTESKLVVKPSGRILLDAGLFDASDEINNQLNDGMAVPDMRVGFKAPTRTGPLRSTSATPTARWA